MRVGNLRKISSILMISLLIPFYIFSNAMEAKADSVTSTIPVGSHPFGIGVNTASNMIYVANTNDNTVSVINGATNTVIQTIPVRAAPTGVGVNPTTNLIYVANTNNNTVSVISGETNTVVKTISGLGNSPYIVAVNPVANKIYVS